MKEDNIEKGAFIAFIAMLVIVAIGITALEVYVQGNWKKFEENYYMQEECYERINI